MNVDRSKTDNGYTLKKAQSRLYHAETITDGDHIAILANKYIQAESLLHSREQTTGDIGFQVKANKIELMSFKLEGVISTLSGERLKLVNKITCIGSSATSTESDVNIHECMNCNQNVIDHMEVLSLIKL